MFKPCPNCGFLVALIAGREASQRCPRCSSALVDEADLPAPQADVAPRRRYRDAAIDEPAGHAVVQEQDVTAVDDAPARRVTPPAATDDPAAGAVAGPEAAAAPASPDPGTTSIDADAPEPSSHAIASAEATPAATTAAHDGPSFVRRRRAPRPAGRHWPWAVALPLLALLLAAQLLFAQRADLARDARWRPLVMHACSMLGCDVPAWREPAAYAMLARGVRPARPGVLHVSATVRNDARWPQPPPVVVLRLADVEGRPVGARAVAPADYGRREALVAPGDSLDIAFDVHEPAARVESFDFQLQ